MWIRPLPCRVKLRLGLVLAALLPTQDALWAGASWAADPTAEYSTAEVRNCMAGNEPESSSTQTILMRATDRMGAVTDTRANLYWKKDEEGLSSLMVRLFDPPDMRGAGLLILEKSERSDMFLYLPEVGRSRRVTKHMAGGSLFGTDFTYEDFERVYGMIEDGDSKRLEDQVLDDRAVYVIEGRPTAEQESAYERTVVFVNKETCIPLKMEFYEVGDRLRKVILADPEKVVAMGSVRIPGLLQARDIRDGTSSELVVEKLKVDEEVPRKIFSLRWLESGRD